MQKKEAQFQTKFNHWLRNKFQQTAVFELKVSINDSLPFSRIEKHQINSLLAVNNGTFVYKISDQSQGYKPFDCFSLSYIPAYVVVLYPSKRFYLIEINDFIKISKTGNKSLSEPQAQKVATFSCDDF